MSEVTSVLERLRAGDAAAFDELVPLVYQQLRVQARRYLHGRDNGLQATELVHEVFLKMVGRDADWQSSRHFFHAAAEVMRQILVSHARSRSAQKRGGLARRVELGDEPGPAVDGAAEGAADGVDFEALDLALAELRKRDERRYQVVMLRYFAGLSDAEAARALQVSEKTVGRDWAVARAFLRSRMGGAVAERAE